MTLCLHKDTKKCREVKQNIQKRRRSLLRSIFKPLLETAGGSRLSKHLTDKLTVKKSSVWNSCHPRCLSHTAEIYRRVTDAAFQSQWSWNNRGSLTGGQLHPLYFSTSVTLYVFTLNSLNKWINISIYKNKRSLPPDQQKCTSTAV